MSPPDRYAVIGYPVQHSRSPFIHGMFAQQTSQNLVYRLLEVPPEQFVQAVEQFFAEGGRGLNVTVPHKQSAYKWVRKRTPRAELAGAVNTLALQEDGVLGDNTDGAGLIADLTRNLGLDLRARRILLLGAGGAARGVLAPLLSTAPTLIEIANRTVERAVDLAREFQDLGTVCGTSFDAVSAEPFDLIINATSASLQDTVPPVPDSVIGEHTVCYDMAYGRGHTAFTLWAKANHAARAVKGWGMLVEQAAESFCLWRGIRPDTQPVLAALKKSPSN